MGNQYRVFECPYTKTAWSKLVCSPSLSVSLSLFLTRQSTPSAGVLSACSAGLRWALIRVLIMLRLFVSAVWDRVFWIELLPAPPSHPFSIFEWQKSVSCLQVHRIELSIVASPLIPLCVEPSIGALSGKGGLYDVQPSGSSQPTSTPSLQNRMQLAKRPPRCCGYHLHPLRHQQGSDKTCILGCYDRAWHCLLPCLLLSRSQLGILTPTSSIITSLGSKQFHWARHLKLLHSYHSRFLLHSFIAPHCIAFRHLGGWGRSSKTSIPAPSLTSSHSLCAPFSLLQSSQSYHPTFLTYQSQDGPPRFTFTPPRLRSTSLRRR